jgi:hypothetical protein
MDIARIEPAAASGKAMSALLEKDGGKWRVVRLVGGVNF